jgi:hypothetical protein
LVYRGGDPVEEVATSLDPSAQPGVFDTRKPISAEEVLKLRATLWSDGSISPEEADASFELNAAAAPSNEWTDFFVEALSEYLISRGSPRGYVGDDDAEWLIRSIARDGRVESQAELELTVKLLEHADYVPQSLKHFVLAEIEKIVVTGIGPTRRGGELTPGRIDDAEVALLRRLIFAPAGDGPAKVSRSEAEMLFRLKDATLNADNSKDWQRLFIQGVANHLMGSSTLRPAVARRRCPAGAAVQGRSVGPRAVAPRPRIAGFRRRVPWRTRSGPRPRVRIGGCGRRGGHERGVGLAQAAVRTRRRSQPDGAGAARFPRRGRRPGALSLAVPARRAYGASLTARRLTMGRTAWMIGGALCLVACNKQPEIKATNASVEEVAQKVQTASAGQSFVRPGLWQSKVTIQQIDMPGMPPEIAQRMNATMARNQSHESSSCLTSEDVKRPKGDFFAGKHNECRYDHFTMSGGKIDALMHCRGAGGGQIMQLAGSYSPDSYQMQMSTKTEGGGQAEKGMAMRMRVDAHRVGECSAQKG